MRICLKCGEVVCGPRERGFRACLGFVVSV